MRAFTFFLFFSIFSLTATNANFQDSKVSIKKNNATIEEILNEIESQTNLLFIYTDEVDVEATTSVNAENKPVKEVLSTILGDNVSFQQAGNHIIISKQAASASEKDVQQDNKLNVTGVVTDSKGESLPGAVIIAKNESNNVATTDMDGKYTITINPGTQLEFSYIGYLSHLVNPNGKSVLDVTLQEDSEMLDEVVVVGYGTQKKANMTGAISEIKASEFVEDRPATHLGSALQGKVAGLQVSRSNARPGSDFSFNIRGGTSFNEDGDVINGSPLILVDGVEMNANIIPPEDIESVTVLKDAASAAIYGARAAFGVMLITTKSGKKNQKVTIGYSNNFSWSTPTDLPTKVNPEEQIRIGGLAWGNANGDYNSYWGHNVTTWLNLYETVEERNTYRIVDGIFYPLGNTDMIQEMVEPGFMQRHNVSVSGGSERISYYASAGLTAQDGILVSDRDKYNRKNFNLKLDADITKWASLQLTTGYIDSETSFPYIPNGEDYLYSVSYLRPTFWLSGIHDTTNLPYGFSPQIIDYGAPNYIKSEDINMQFSANIRPFKGFEINARYTFRNNTETEKEHVNSYEVIDPESGGAYFYKNSVNSLKKDFASTKFNVIDVWGQYETTFAENHRIKLMVGYNQESYSLQSVFAKGDELLSDNLPSLNLAIGNTFVGDEVLEWSTRSAFFRFNYDYKEKYLLEVVGRYDGSSKFQKDNRFVFLPSASVGWMVSKESFMNWSKNVLDVFKLRASYGAQGNQGINPYAYLPTMATDDVSWIVGGKKPIIVEPGGLVSTSFTWETVTTMNFGVDLGLFDNRLNATFEYYIRDTEGMLTAGQVLPSVLGTDVPMENAADLRVNGWELSLNWRDYIGDDFSYNIGAMLYDSRTMITKFANPTGLLSEYYKGGYINDIWGYETDRLFREDDFTVDASGNRAYKEGVPTQDIIFGNRVPMPGDVKYKDLDGDGKVDYGTNTLSDSGDYKIIGNSTPRYQFGINLGANYKGFDLSIFIQGVAKRDLWISNSLIFAARGSYESVFTHTMDFWEEDNLDAFYPRPVADYGWNRQQQTKYLQNAAYARLKNLTFGYSLPDRVIEKIRLSKVRLYFSAENLFTITGLPKGIDPEIGGSHAYPFARELSFGIDLRF